MKLLVRVLAALALAIFAAVVSATFTTDYHDFIKHGASYLPALGAGLASVWHHVWSAATSPWLLIPLGAILLIATTVVVTLRITKGKKPDRLVQLGWKMSKAVQLAQHDQQNRDFRTIYHGTMQACRELQAFMVEVQEAGIPVPHPQSQSAEEWIDLFGDYCTAVGPFLRSGNVTHAMNMARFYAEKSPPKRFD